MFVCVDMDAYAVSPQAVGPRALFARLSFALAANANRAHAENNITQSVKITGSKSIIQFRVRNLC